MAGDSNRNDDDRAEAIARDEELYDWWISAHQTEREFIRANRDEIDAAIDRAG